MPYNNKMFKEAKVTSKPKVVSKPAKDAYSDSEVFTVHDTDRYLTDDYTINTAISENVDKYAIGVYVTNDKVGVSGYQEYWLFPLSEKKRAMACYNELKRRVSEITDEFEYQNWPLSLLSPMIRNLLIDLEPGQKERSGVFNFNEYAIDPYLEPDWRVTLYGGRYTEHHIEQMQLHWNVNSDEMARQLEQDGKGTRDRINRYRYADETKLAQFNRMVEMVQKRWPYISTAAIISFLTIFLAKGGDSQALASQLEQNPQAVRSQIPEVEPDFTYDEPTSTPETTPTPTPAPDHFSSALESTLGFEGGYVNHPNDPGGETNRGITRNTYEQWLRTQGLPSRNLDMQNIPDEHVKQIYRDRYWNKVRGDDLPPKVAQQVFDYAVHSGPSRAVKALQAAVGAKTDGRFGPSTLAATQKYLQTHGETALANAVLEQRRSFLEGLLEKEQYAPFANGWRNRLDSLGQMIGNDSKPMRDRNIPEQQTRTFQSPHADFWSETKYPSV